MMLGLFHCNNCGFEELKRVPLHVVKPIGDIERALNSEVWGWAGRISYDCPRANPLTSSICFMGEMVLDTRYNFAGLLACDIVIVHYDKAIMDALPSYPAWRGYRK